MTTNPDEGPRTVSAELGLNAGDWQMRARVTIPVGPTFAGTAIGAASPSCQVITW